MKKTIFILAVLGALFVVAGCSDEGPDTGSVTSEMIKESYSGKLISLDSMMVNEKPVYDWGDVDIEGGVLEKTFTFQNDSADEDLILYGLQTSCMCTSAIINLPNNEKSPKFGMHNNPKWSHVIKSKEKFKVDVFFDPIFHGPDVTGSIMRQVLLASSSRENDPLVKAVPDMPATTILEMVVNANVLSHTDYSTLNTKKLEEELNNNYSFEMGSFVFVEKEFDFGKIKQSGGIVEHDFAFIYKGEEDIEITGTPASCACTEGEIDKKTYSKGEEGLLKVFFDPNLHEEPEGKFFKTVNILTNPKLEIIPEVKIWAEIDLDLGEESYKLQNHEEDEQN